MHLKLKIQNVTLLRHLQFDHLQIFFKTDFQFRLQ